MNTQTIGASLLPEFDSEMASTRKVLERVPDDKLDWKAHPRSNSIGWVATHLADLPGWANIAFNQPSINIAPQGAPERTPPAARTREENLAVFDKNVAVARELLATKADPVFAEPWTLQSGGKEVFTMTRGDVVRRIIMNHAIHHRAHLCVYFRLNEIPVPALYGPSGDEQV